MDVRLPELPKPNEGQYGDYWTQEQIEDYAHAAVELNRPVVTAEALAAELAKEDGYDINDMNCGLYDLRWSSGTSPEPLGDAWSMDYLPRAERIVAALTNTPGSRMADKIEPVGHLHSNGDCCQDRKVISDFWPVNLYSQPQMDALVAERDLFRFETIQLAKDVQRAKAERDALRVKLESATNNALSNLERAERAEAEAAAQRSVTSRVTEAFRALWDAKDDKAAAQCQHECEAAVTALFVEDMTQSTPHGQEG